MFALAHLSDPHLGPLPRPRLVDLAGKRLLGFVNWQLRRHACHRAEILAAIIDDVKAAAPDHIAVTGDLINIALEQEFAPACAWLEQLGPPDRVTLVPGNHDIYVRATAHQAELCWGKFMCGDDASGSPNRFPFVRRRGPIALVGLSTALPTPPLMASGKLGHAQTERLAAVLLRLKDEGMFRVVLIHHPPLGQRARHKRLVDAEPFLRVLEKHGAELVLHGHDHLHALHWLEAANGRIPVLGAPSSSAALGSRHDDPAAYYLFHIEGRSGAWRCEMISRGFGGSQDGVVELERRILTR
jgi:3',5'-cyclic AMP phosphodiesterase CpdA